MGGLERDEVDGGGKTSNVAPKEYDLKSEIVAVPWPFKKFVWKKMYPTKFPVWPAAESNWLSKTVQVAPAASVPSADSPAPGLTVALVVNENVVPAPPADAVGKKLTVTVPAEGIAPPVVEPNGSDEVFATAMPVSNGAKTRPYGKSMVVLAGTMLTTVTGPRSN